MPRDLLFTAPRSHAAGNAGGGYSARGGRLGRPDQRTRHEIPLGANLREQGRGHGLLKSASARPGLGGQFPAPAGGARRTHPETAS